MQTLNLPDWVIARLKQDNPDISAAIVDMVIWADRVKCWLYQTDSDLAAIIEDLAAVSQDSNQHSPD
jgi:hypothetical protein